MKMNKSEAIPPWLWRTIKMGKLFKKKKQPGKMGGCEGSEVLMAVCLRETGILPVVRITTCGLWANNLLTLATQFTTSS